MIPVDRRAFPYRMKDLTALTGMPRQAIHFYIQQGLVPEGRKSGPTSAFYADEHLERIRLVKKLQEERFLPLKAIRAVLDGDAAAFTPEQRQLLADVKERLPRRLTARAHTAETVDARGALTAAGLTKKDLDEMVDIGLVATSRGPRRQLLIAKDDIWILQLWGEVRAAGFTRELGFTAKVLAIYEDGVQSIVDREVALLTERLAAIAPAKVAAMLDRALPRIGEFLTRYHEEKVKQLFASIETGQEKRPTTRESAR